MTAARDRADRLWSLVIRARGYCERCGPHVPIAYHDLQAAHILRRKYSAVRCDPENGWSLCARCHLIVDTVGDEWEELVLSTIGPDMLARLDAKARDGDGQPYRDDYWRDRALELGGMGR